MQAAAKFGAVAVRNSVLIVDDIQRSSCKSTWRKGQGTRAASHKLPRVLRGVLLPQQRRQPRRLPLCIQRLLSVTLQGMMAAQNHHCEGAGLPKGAALACDNKRSSEVAANALGLSRDTSRKATSLPS